MYVSRLAPAQSCGISNPTQKYCISLSSGAVNHPTSFNLFYIHDCSCVWCHYDL